MAAKIGGGDEDAMMADINVTPFVDIVLVLLIILMVTSAEIVRAAIKVDLPSAASGGQTVESTLNLVITKEGEVFLDGQAVTEAQIIARIKEDLKSNPKLQAVIAADKGVVYGRVVRIIDIVKQNGIVSFALNIEREAAAQ